MMAYIWFCFFLITLLLLIFLFFNLSRVCKNFLLKASKGEFISLGNCEYAALVSNGKNSLIYLVHINAKEDKFTIVEKLDDFYKL